jgi:uncharacterized protein YecE (DUF72 family)
VKQDEELGYYAKRMPATEINATFHGLQTVATLQKWRSKVSVVDLGDLPC